MEKRKPSHDLDRVKVALGDPSTLAITTTALQSAVSLGFDRAGIVAVIRSIKRSMFVKSMTTHADHRSWQDVYHVPVEDFELYVKFQDDAVTAFRLVSFKER
jgi:motility quorum-sensing regulator / GCU-specific mRNA interferase toxin